jgi:hypothetical protein
MLCQDRAVYFSRKCFHISNESRTYAETQFLYDWPVNYNEFEILWIDLLELIYCRSQSWHLNTAKPLACVGSQGFTEDSESSFSFVFFALTHTFAFENFPTAFC